MKVLKIADKFVKKYDYLSNSNLNNLFEIISKDKEEIEKLRKEYNQNLKEDLFENNKNKEKEENIKEDNKENNEKEDEEIKTEKIDI